MFWYKTIKQIKEWQGKYDTFMAEETHRLDTAIECIQKDRVDLNACINYVRKYIQKKGAK